MNTTKLNNSARRPLNVSLELLKNIAFVCLQTYFLSKGEEQKNPSCHHTLLTVFSILFHTYA